MRVVTKSTGKCVEKDRQKPFLTIAKKIERKIKHNYQSNWHTNIMCTLEETRVFSILYDVGLWK